MGSEPLNRALTRSVELHAAIAPLWEELPEPPSRRSLLVVGFGSIVREHAISQCILVQSEFGVSATTLVRPAFESLVRAIWCHAGADDDWITKFLTANPDAVNSDAETEMGPRVGEMLLAIKQHHPAHVYQPLEQLKKKTWRAMHSYVHGGIRPIVHSFIEVPAKEATSLVLNSNTMALMATNVVRMACGLSSPQIPLIYKQYADCFPPAEPA